jgi:hypothetical protein
MKAKTPEDLASAEAAYSKYTLYLEVKAMEYIKKRAAKANIGASKIVNEAINAYIADLKDKETR